MSCYSLTYVDSIRHWIYMQSESDIPEPVYSTLQGIAEILTAFVCVNFWDELFRLTLISHSCSSSTIEKALEHHKAASSNVSLIK